MSRCRYEDIEVLGKDLLGLIRSSGKPFLEQRLMIAFDRPLSYHKSIRRNLFLPVIILGLPNIYIRTNQVKYDDVAAMGQMIRNRWVRR